MSTRRPDAPGMGHLEVEQAVSRLGRVHFIGVGAGGMSGIARVLLARGCSVSGSDAKSSRALLALQALGAQCFVGHLAAHVKDVDTVVTSGAISRSNPELVEAQTRGLRVISRSSVLSMLLAGRRGVVVAGAHGKTTTTAMLTAALQSCRADPSFSMGSTVSDSAATAYHGTGNIFVTEIDDDDEPSHAYEPEVLVVTGIETDHLFPGSERPRDPAGFDALLAALAPNGSLVVSSDDRGARQLAHRAEGMGVRVCTFGFADEADVRLGRLVRSAPGVTGEVTFGGRRLGPMRLLVPGRHNAANAAAALAAGLRLGYPSDDLLSGLSLFSGVRRRFEARGSVAGIRVFDDYAHHPTEVRATLATAREVAEGGRVIVAFQPHLYSRTRALAGEIGAALGLADEVLVMDVHPGHETPEPGVTGALVARAVPLPHTQVAYETSWSAVPGWLVSRARPGDVVVTAGAGDVTLIGPEVLELLEGEPVLTA